MRGSLNGVVLISLLREKMRDSFDRAVAMSTLVRRRPLSSVDVGGDALRGSSRWSFESFVAESHRDVVRDTTSTYDVWRTSGDDVGEQGGGRVLLGTSLP